MVTANEKKTLRMNLEKYEGKVPHMYLDSVGYVTVGVGHLLSSVAAAQALAFRNSKNVPATRDEIKADYEAVKKQPPNRLAAMYKKYTELTLPTVDIDKLTDKHIESFERELKQVYTGFDGFPTEARLALFDIIFNVGMTNLRTAWPNFNAAIKAKDWQKAADSSSRKPPVSPARNKYVKDLLETCARKAKSASTTLTP
jgi:GH24 family phage-related lysozyme (muramidase)